MLTAEGLKQLLLFLWRYYILLQMTLEEAYMIGFRDGAMFHIVPSDDEIKDVAKENWHSFFEGHVVVKEEKDGVDK